MRARSLPCAIGSPSCLLGRLTSRLLLLLLLLPDSLLAGCPIADLSARPQSGAWTGSLTGRADQYESRHQLTVGLSVPGGGATVGSHG